jgi:glucokinase
MGRELYLGLDLGGTKVAVGVVDQSGRVLARTQSSTSDLRAGGDPLASIIRLAQGVLGAGDAAGLRGVGVALPGPTERETLRLLAAPTIPEIEGVPLAPALERAFGCPAAGDNDANGAALAESRFGGGAGYGQVAYFTVSTGIGGGIVMEGRVLRGSRGTSAEFGHQVILPVGGPPCDCGGHGCLEALASGRGIVRRARLALVAQELPLPEGELRAEWVAEQARQGAGWAVEVWRETALFLGAGISNVINILDPDVVVLGGGVSTGAVDLLLEPVRDVVRARCMPSLEREVPVVTAVLGTEVGIVGAACLAMEAGL